MESDFKRDDLCRVCLSSGDEMQELFFKENGLVEQIEYCTGLLLVPGPSLPNLICQPCVSRLQTAHSFKTTCLASHDSLHSHLADPTISADEITKISCIPITPVTVKVEMDMDVADEMSDDDDEFGGGWMENVRKSIRIKMKKEKVDSSDNAKPRRALKRGPHKRRGRPARGPQSASTADSQDDVKQSDSWTSEAVVPRPFKVRRVPCAACDLQFTSKVELAAHRARAHPTPRPPPPPPPPPRPRGGKCTMWICEVCGKTFAHQSSHYTHLRSHLPPLHECPQCEYRTWHRHDLTKHLRIHNGEKNFQCAVCAHSFYNSSNLLSHMRRTHERSRPHACAQCPKRFYDRTKLRRHQDSHDAIKRFECEVCHSCFTRRCYWKKHLHKQHGIVIPPARCGRQRLNFEVGEDLIDAKKDWPSLLRDKETVPPTEEGLNEQTDPKHKIS